MANLTDNGQTAWFPIPAHETAMASASGDFGGGTLVVQVQDLDSGGTAIALNFTGTGYDGTDDFAVNIENHSGQTRNYRFSLSGATSPDIDCTIE